MLGVGGEPTTRDGGTAVTQLTRKATSTHAGRQGNARKRGAAAAGSGAVNICGTATQRTRQQPCWVRRGRGEFREQERPKSKSGGQPFEDSGSTTTHRTHAAPRATASQEIHRSVARVGRTAATTGAPGRPRPPTDASPTRTLSVTRPHSAATQAHGRAQNARNMIKRACADGRRGTTPHHSAAAARRSNTQCGQTTDGRGSSGHTHTAHGARTWATYN